MTEEDVKELQTANDATKRLKLRCHRTARLFQEADAQDTTLPYADIAALYAMNLFAVKQDVDKWEKQKHLPHRGRVREIGPTTTHKA